MKQLFPGAFVFINVLFLHQGLQAQTMDVSWASYAPAVSNIALPESRNTIHRISASFTGNRVTLNWQNDGPEASFVIERSTDGVHFEALGKTVATSADHPSAPFVYSDKLRRQLVAKTDLFYRLGYPSSAGMVYTRPILVSTQRKGAVDYAVVFPRPEDNDIQIIAGLRENSYVSVRITDNQGNLVLDRRMKFLQGDRQLSLAGTHMMAPGDYWLDISANGQPALRMQLVKE